MRYKSQRVDLRLSNADLDSIQELLDSLRKTMPRASYQSPWNRTTAIMLAVNQLLTTQKIALVKIAKEPLPLFEPAQADKVEPVAKPVKTSKPLIPGPQKGDNTRFVIRKDGRYGLSGFPVNEADDVDICLDGAWESHLMLKDKEGYFLCVDRKRFVPTNCIGRFTAKKPIKPRRKKST